MDRDDKLLQYRVKRLEDSQELLAQSLSDISKIIIGMQTWGKAALFMFGVLHPIFVGVIIRMLTNS